jgi:hypothetical protein
MSISNVSKGSVKSEDRSERGDRAERSNSALFEGKNNPADSTERQRIVTGKLKRTSSGAELICFSLYLDMVEIVCLVNLPAEIYDDAEVQKAKDEGHDPSTAPVYVKYKLAKPRTSRGDDRESDR